MTYLVVHARLIGLYLRTTKRKNRDSDIEVHMKICVLALLIQRVVELTVGQSGFSFGNASLAFKPLSSEPLPTDFSSEMNPLRNSGMYSKTSIFQCLNPSWRFTP